MLEKWQHHSVDDSFSQLVIFENGFPPPELKLQTIMLQWNLPCSTADSLWMLARHGKLTSFHVAKLQCWFQSNSRKEKIYILYILYILYI